MAGVAQVDNSMATEEGGLTARWTKLRPHTVQQAWRQTRARFTVVPAGRRSGKTEIAKRRAIIRALRNTQWDDAWYVFGAPTINQARRIFWRDLKAFIPKELRDGKPRESEMTIRLINGAELTVMGMEEPARVEGRPLNGIVLDEYANMKAGAWGENIRPALADRQGWADLIGVPEGRNHYFQLFEKARLAPPGSEWAAFTWKSADILPASEIASAREDLDPLTFAQEFEASFLNFEGRAYYTFDRSLHALHPLRYVPDQPLIFCFDFNTSPGVAVICQEQDYAKHSPVRHSKLLPHISLRGFTAVLGEVWIPSGSNSERIAKQLAEKWAFHKGDILLDGDATGGAKGSAKVAGSDWDIIRRVLQRTFGSRVKSRYPKANPKERVRINSVNSRFMSVDGTIRMLVNPETCTHLINDLEGVSVVEGGSGEIDKKQGDDLTHISDALGYYICRKWPVDGGARMALEQVA